MQFTLIQDLIQLVVLNKVESVAALVLGVFLIYLIFRFFTSNKKEKMDEIKYVPTKNTIKGDVIKSTTIKEPEDFNELVRYLRDKFLLIDITLATSDGFPIASTSDKPEDESAIAPEILQKIGRKIFDADKVILLGKDYKLGVFEINPDVIGFIKASRDIHFIEIDKIKEEVNKFLETKI